MALTESIHKIAIISVTTAKYIFFQKQDCFFICFCCRKTRQIYNFFILLVAKIMTCIYCNSSNKCDVYDTPEYRKEIHLWKKCCGFSIHPDSHAFWCHNKPANKKRYICFGKGTHLTVHCTQRLISNVYL